MIRQAISCDICGAEKKQTNHWFVVSDQAGELRVSGWSSRNRLRAGSKHLCGQTCLHKLVDEFISRTLAARGPSSPAEIEEALPGTDASLTSKAAYQEPESSARLLTPAAPIPPQRVTTTLPAVVAMPARLLAEPPRVATTQPAMQQAPNYSSRHWRAEAWERERERELRAVERRPDLSAHRRQSS